MTTNHTPELDALLHQAMEADFQAEKARKLKNFQYLNQYIKKGQILFTGSSLMEHFPVAELYAESDLSKNGLLVYNRGIGGYTTDEFLRDIDTMLLDLEPSRLFINIGTNDMNSTPAASDSNASADIPSDADDEPSWMPHLIQNYEKILQICQEKLPKTEIYMMAYYPHQHPGHLHDERPLPQGKIQDPHQRKSPPGQCEDRTAGGTTRLSLYRCQRRPCQ